MAIGLRRFLVTGCVVYLLFTCYTAYLLLTRTWETTNNKNNQVEPSAKPKNAVDDITSDDWNPWGEEFEEDGENQSVLHVQNVQKNSVVEPLKVEIWGKAAIGLYLWEHILGGTLQEDPLGLWSMGTTRNSDIVFTFRTGPSVVPSTIPLDVEYLVLVLNGRTDDKVEFARTWLDFVVSGQMSQIRGLGLVLLGEENCHNDWLKRYLDSSLLKVVFLVYDSPLVDNNRVFQWPLGVATYRNFPKMSADKVQADVLRPYTCNFYGTVYANSTREDLVKAVSDVVNVPASDKKPQCLMKIRSSWEAKESEESLGNYLSALLSSDLTLSPAGLNTECYRLYEALSCGSVPVVLEPQPSSSSIVNSGTSSSNMCESPPLRLLRAYGAPFLYVSSWEHLPNLLLSERNLEDSAKLSRRKRILQWYSDFLSGLREHFVTTLKKKFLA